MNIIKKAAVFTKNIVQKTDLYTNTAEKALKKASAYNRRHPYRQPRNTAKAVYETIMINDRPCLIIRSGRHHEDSHHVLLFIHGGGEKDSWKDEIPIAFNYGDALGMDVFYPMYPSLADGSVQEQADVIYGVYLVLAKAYGPDHIAVIGDSYGGYLGLLLISLLNKRSFSLKMPGIMVLNSPFALPQDEVEKNLAMLYEKEDFLISKKDIERMKEEIYFADQNTPEDLLYPSMMDFHNAPETFIYYGEETIACTSGSVRKGYAKAGCSDRLHLHIEPGMMHCYACAPVFRQSRRDFHEALDHIRNSMR